MWMKHWKGQQSGNIVLLSFRAEEERRERNREAERDKQREVERHREHEREKRRKDAEREHASKHSHNGPIHPQGTQLFTV